MAGEGEGGVTSQRERGEPKANKVPGAESPPALHPFWRLFGLIIGLLTITAPFAIYYLYTTHGYRSAFIYVVVLLALSRVRLIATHKRLALAIGAQLAAIVGYLIIGFLYPDPLFIKMLSPFINTVLMIAFLYSLIHPPSAIETFARMRHPNLPDVAVAYCRNVTWVWIGFFFFDSLLVIYVSLYGDMWQWALLTGVINYLLVGLLFGGEWIYRRVRFGDLAKAG